MELKLEFDSGMHFRRVTTTTRETPTTP